MACSSLHIHTNTEQYLHSIAPIQVVSLSFVELVFFAYSARMMNIQNHKFQVGSERFSRTSLNEYFHTKRVASLANDASSLAYLADKQAGNHRERRI